MSSNSSSSRDLTSEQVDGRRILPIRILMVILMFLGAFTSTLSRINMSTTIIAMCSQSSLNVTAPIETITQNGTRGKRARPVLHSYRKHQAEAINGTAICGVFEGIGHAPPGVDESHHFEFHWTETQQDNLKGAFLVGYGLALIPSGRMSEQYSAKRVVTLGGSLHALLNLMTPWAARSGGYALLLTLRVVLGIAGAMIMPPFFALIARWVLNDEKSKAVAALKIGYSLANILLNYASGHLFQIDFDGGWPLVFYFSGLFNLFWLALWCCLASDHPSESRLITSIELTLISNGRNLQPGSSGRSCPSPANLSLYLRMLSSVPVLATLCSKLANSWFENLLQAKLPQYMIAVLGLDIGQTSLWNCIFNAVLFVSTLFSGILADFAISRDCLSKTNTRKTFDGFATFGIAFCSVLLVTSACNQSYFLALVFLAAAFDGLLTGGSSSIVVDMTSDYAASLIALICTITMLFGFATPHLVTLILNNHSESTDSWAAVFVVTAVLHITSGVIFSSFASAENQNWEKLGKVTPPKDVQLKQIFNSEPKSQDVLWNKEFRNKEI